MSGIEALFRFDVELIKYTSLELDRINQEYLDLLEWLKKTKYLTDIKS